MKSRSKEIVNERNSILSKRGTSREFIGNKLGRLASLKKIHQ